MLTQPNDVARSLAREFQTPEMFMVEYVAEMIGRMSRSPEYYREHSGTLTDLGESRIRAAVASAWVAGLLDRQLTAWSAQCPA